MFQPMTKICLRSLAFLVAEARGKIVRSREIGARLGISPTYAAKALQPLERKGWLRSIRGRKGGWQLSVDPASVTIYDVVQVMEPDQRWKRCVVGHEVCEDDCACPFHETWKETVRKISTVMKDCRLDRLDEFLPPCVGAGSMKAG